MQTPLSIRILRVLPAAVATVIGLGCAGQLIRGENIGGMPPSYNSKALEKRLAEGPARRRVFLDIAVCTVVIKMIVRYFDTNSIASWCIMENKTQKDKTFTQCCYFTVFSNFTLLANLPKNIYRPNIVLLCVIEHQTHVISSDNKPRAVQRRRARPHHCGAQLRGSSEDMRKFPGIMY